MSMKLNLDELVPNDYDSARLNADLVFALKKWIVYMLKKTNGKFDKLVDLNQLEIVLKPLERNDYDTIQSLLSTRVRVTVNLRTDSVFFRAFSGDLNGILTRAIRKNWIANDSKWIELLSF